MIQVSLPRTELSNVGGRYASEDPTSFSLRGQGDNPEISEKILWLRSSAYLAFEEERVSTRPLITIIINKTMTESLMPSCPQRYPNAVTREIRTRKEEDEKLFIYTKHSFYF